LASAGASARHGRKRVHVAPNRPSSRRPGRIVAVASPDTLVEVDRQATSADGTPIRGDQVGAAWTDNTSSVSFNLTPGVYVVVVNDEVVFGVVVEASKSVAVP
jgi:hypothetical protein